MKNRFAAALVALFVLSTCAGPASAFEGGGRKPSEAPLVIFGQHYAGQLNNHEIDSNFVNHEVAIWKLPPVSTRDQVVVNWHALPFTHSSGFPICMALAQGIDDFNWGTVFRGVTERSCYESGPAYSLSPSGTAQTSLTIQSTDATSTYLEFYASSYQTEPIRFETYPYDFTVEAPRHYLGLSLAPTKEVPANGSISGSVTSADGSPAADGLPFTLSATWSGGGIASYTASTAGGKLNFGLALPESAAGKSVTFVASRPADASYQAVTSPKMTVQVAKAPPPPPSLCELARRHLASVNRQYSRISRHAALARGPNRRRLMNRKHRVKRTLNAARAQKEGSC